MFQAHQFYEPEQTIVPEEPAEPQLHSANGVDAVAGPSSTLRLRPDVPLQALGENNYYLVNTRTVTFWIFVLVFFTVFKIQRIRLSQCFKEKMGFDIHCTFHLPFKPFPASTPNYFITRISKLFFQINCLKYCSESKSDRKTEKLFLLVVQLCGYSIFLEQNPDHEYIIMCSISCRTSQENTEIPEKHECICFICNTELWLLKLCKIHS